MISLKEHEAKKLCGFGELTVPAYDDHTRFFSIMMCLSDTSQLKAAEKTPQLSLFFSTVTLSEASIKKIIAENLIK
jgi:hypothetical protein